MEVRAGYKQTEVGVIPEDWDAVPLKGRVGIAHGFAFASEYFANHGPYRLATPGHFYEAGGFRDIGEKQKYYVGSVPSDYVLQSGDVIVAMTEQADGLLGSAAVIPEDQVYLHNQRLGRVAVFSSSIHLDYLVYVFNSLSYRTKVRETAAGTKVKHTSPEKLLAIIVRLPPLPEQRAIAEALSDVDALLGALDRLIAKKRDLKQAAMQQLLTGQTRLPGFEGAWEVKRLGEVAEIVMGQSPSSSSYNSIGRGLPLIQGNADISGRKAIKRFFTTQVTKRGNAGDILMSVRAPVGEVARTTFNVCLGRGVCAIRFPNDFLYHLLVFQEPSWAKHSKGSTFDSVNSADVRAVEIKLPNDTAEQTAIAAVLSDMDAELTALEARRDKTRLLKQGMMQELLTGRVRLV